MTEADTFTRSPDPTLPCPYCCGWVDDPEDDTGQRVIPIHPDGTPIEVMFDGIHPECQDMVDAHMAEVAREREATGGVL